MLLLLPPQSRLLWHGTLVVAALLIWLLGVS